MPSLGFWTQLSCGKPAFVEDQVLHIVCQISEHDLGLGTLDQDGADEKPHMRLLLLTVDPAIGCKPGFIRLEPGSGIGPHIGCCVVRRDHFAKL